MTPSLCPTLTLHIFQHLPQHFWMNFLGVTHTKVMADSYKETVLVVMLN